MFKLLGWLHLVLFRLIIWLVRLPLRALLATFQAMLALLGEEVQRWVGILAGGVMVFVLAKTALMFEYPGKKHVLLTVALMGCIWLFAVMRAFSYTIHNNLRAVRTRQMFRDLNKTTQQLPGQIQTLQRDVRSGVAKRSRGTPVEDMFRENRSAKAERAERQKQERHAAAEQAARDQQEAAERERHLDKLADAEPDPFK